MDIELYESVVRSNSAPLYRYCSYRLKHDHQLTEEAVNDVMRILFMKWDTLDITDDILRYLYRVADNCIMQARERDKKYYSKHSSLEEAIDEGIVNEPVYFNDYFHDTNASELFIRKVVGTLPAEQQRIFKYRYLDGKTIFEIVSLTGIAYSSVRLRLKKIEEYVKYQISNNY